MTVYFKKVPDGFEGEAWVYQPGGQVGYVRTRPCTITEVGWGTPSNWPGLIEDIEVARAIIADLLGQLDKETGRAKKAWDALDDIEALCDKGFGRDEDG